MARLSTYTSDTVDKSDKLIGTSSGGETKNFVISDISTFLANTNAAGVAGQITYQYKASSADKASGTFLGTFSSGSTFANLTSIKVSKYPADSSLSVVNLLTSYNNNQIILSSINHPDNFGVYSISNVAQDGSSDYYDITVGFVSGNGSLSNDNYYGINSTSIVASAYATLTGTQVLTNKTLTSPVLNTGVSGTAIKDEDDMSSNSATHLATQQSIKAYVDNQLTASDLDFQGDSGGALSIDLDSETLTLAGGTGLTSTGSSNTITFAVDAAQTGITSIYATDLILGEDSQTAIDFGTANEIDFKVDNAARLTLTSSALYPVTNNQIDLGTSSLEFKDAYFDGTVTADAFAGPLTGDVTGNVSGTAATVTGSAQSNITSLGTLTTLTVDSVIINGTTIGHTGDTDLMTVASGVLTVAGEVDATSLDISGDADIDGTLEADAITVNGTALDTHIAGVTVTNATNSAHALVTDNENTNEDNPITFVEGATTSTGNIGLEMDGDFHYNPSTGRLTASQLAGTLQTASQTNITGVGTISTGVWNGTAIASAYLDSDTMHLSVAQTITGEKTIDGSDKFYFRDSAIYLHSDADGYLEMVADTGVSLKIGSTEQVILTDGAFTPTSDSDVDLGSSSKYWKDSYIDSITTTGNVVVGGNLTVSGTTTTVNSTTVAIADSMLKLAKDQADTADAVDFGFYGQYGDSGTHKYAGIFRDLSASGDPWTFFDGLQAEPGTTVNTSGTGYDLADISAGGITSADGFTGTLLTAAQGNITSLGTLSTLTVDNVIINGTTIGHTDDTDLITLADGVFTVAGEIDGTTLDISGNADIDGTTNLDDVDIDGNVQLDGTLTVGVDDTGYDVKLFGATSGDYILWDESDNELETAGGATINIIKDKLKIGGTAVTTTAAELNFLDTAAANTVVNSKAVIYGSSGELAGTLSTAAQGNVTSLGTLSTLTVDNVIINGTTIGHTDDTDLITLADGSATFAGDVAVGFQSNKFIGSSAGNGLYFDGTGNYGMAVNSTLGLGLIFESDGGSAKDFFIGTGNSDPDSATKLLTITQAGNATFAGNVGIKSAPVGNAGTNIISVGTAGSVAGGVQLWAGTGQSHFLQFGDESGTASNHYRGAVGYNHSSDTLSLLQSGTTALSFTGSQAATFAGRVFIGGGSGDWPTSTIGSSAGRSAIIGSDDPILLLHNTGSVAANTGSELWLTQKAASSSDTSDLTYTAGGVIKGYKDDANANALGYLRFDTTTTTGGVQEVLRLDSSKNATFAGDATVKGGELVINSESTSTATTDIDKIHFKKAHQNGPGTALYTLGEIRSTTNGGYSGGMTFYTGKNVGGGSYASTLAMTLDASQNATFAGNVAVGGGALKTYHSNVTSVIELDDQASIFTRANETYIGQNFYYDSGDDGTAIEAGKGTLMRLRRGEINMYFSAASASSADDTHSMQEKFTLTDAGDLTLYGDVNVNLNDTAANVTIISASGQYDDSDDAKSVFELKYYGQGAFHTHRVGSSWNSIIENPNSGGTMEWWINGGQKLQLGNSGNFGVGASSHATYRMLVYADTDGDWLVNFLNGHNGDGNGLLLDATDGSSGEIQRWRTYNGSLKARCMADGDFENANNSYGSTSDKKLKENIVDATPKLDDLCKVKIRNFNKIGEDTKQIGVIAQELEEIFPKMISESEDLEITEDGTKKLGTKTKSVKYSVFVPMLVKAVQEQQEIIEDLKKRIETLEK